MDLSTEQLKELQDLKKALDVASKAYSDAQQAKRRATRADQKRLKQISDDAKAKEAVARADLKRARVQIRSNNVVRALREKFRNSMGGRPLQVIPVANHVHQEHMRGFDDDDSPVLSVEEDGVRALRHLLCQIASRGKVNSFERHITVVQNLLTRLTLWTERSRLERKDEVVKIVKGPAAVCTDNLPGYVEDMRNMARKLIKLRIEAATKKEWSEKFKKLIEGWGKWVAVTFTAFCKRGGVHQPRGEKSQINLSRRILDVVEEDVQKWFREMETEVDRVCITILGHIDNHFSNMEKELDSSDATGGIDLDTLKKQFRNRNRTVNSQISEYCNKLLKDKLRYVSEIPEIRPLN